jgi:hypothetical protein
MVINSIGCFTNFKELQQKGDNMQKEKLESYTPIFIDRQTGEETPADYKVSLYPSEIISKQIENSTAKTILMYKKVK